MPPSSESIEKQRRVNALLDAEGYDALVLGRVDNFAWFTCGGESHVSLAAEAGVGALLIERDRRTLITNNVERPRLCEEEIEGQGFEEEVLPWTGDALAPAVEHLVSDKSIAADVLLPGATVCPDDIARLRWALTPEEVARYRALGRDGGEAIAEACMAAQPGMTEHEVAALLAAEHYERGVAPIVVLVAADERLRKYRHPIPTNTEVHRCVMLVVCGRRHGLIVSATRIVHFGPAPDELQARHQACAAVDGAFIGATRPGARIGDIFSAGREAYRAHGYPDEWQLHHQGGPTGYAAREYRVTQEIEDLVEPNQAFAWNPSIAGTKSEDTIIATPQGPEIISSSPGLPSLTVTVSGVEFPRPDIVVR